LKGDTNEEGGKIDMVVTTLNGRTSKKKYALAGCWVKGGTWLTEHHINQRA